MVKAKFSVARGGRPCPFVPLYGELGNPMLSISYQLKMYFLIYFLATKQV